MIRLTRFFSANNINKNFVRGGKMIRVKTDNYKKWIEENTKLLKMTWHGEQFTKPVSVYIKCYFKDKRKRDIDNVCKPVLDLLVKNGILKDDSLVTIITAEKTYTRFNDLDIEIEIKELD